jgi:arylsulfate sulfotransferase
MKILLSSILCACSLTFAASAPLTVHLRTSRPSPQPVGASIGLFPRIDNADPGMLVVRYSVSTDGKPFRIVRDFSQQRDFVWSPMLYEHDAVVRVTVRNNTSQQTAEQEAPFRIVSRVKGTTSVVTPMAHPLVALFSAPPCAEGKQFQVAFRPEGSEIAARTAPQPCRGSLSNNVLVAGMQADREYRLRSEVVNGGNVQSGSWLPFHTGMHDGDFPPLKVSVPRADRSAVPEPILLRSIAAAGKRSFATDMNGEVIWYLPTAAMLTRVIPGGRFLTIGDGMNSVNIMDRAQVLREFDLAGRVLRETNIGRVAEQLKDRGIQSDCRKGGKECVPSFHHDAVRMPNGHTLVIAGLERMMPAGTQSSKEPVAVLGDIVLELDEDFQVTGAWNSFDHLDINRVALDKATCKEGRGGGGCTPIFLAAEAQAWLHSNGLNYIPDTGDFLMSIRGQSWVIKVDWKNGKGTGKVLWRLGEGGDFKAVSNDPSPWFGFQHDAGFDPPGSNVITLLDNGNGRFGKDPKAHTRGQAWSIDEQSRTATLIHNADLGVYAFAVGSAQLLKNGGYNFEAGFTNQNSNVSHAVETSPDGRIAYAQQLDGVIEYRSFRLPDMYSAPRK